jgi:hypothetical protein
MGEQDFFEDDYSSGGCDEGFSCDECDNYSCNAYPCN